MSNEIIKLKESFIIKDGEIQDLTIRFIGNLNKWIVEYFNNPVDSPMHKAIFHVLERVIKKPVNIRETND